ncbi:MAG: pantetheine-phosphate adenylyltransferase [Nanoarchaeota archaeon]|nr:pantetheine-phosphate adenylyltransferase [Nanoarchaeota archaeon]
MNIAVMPGSFDPVTNGHLDVLERALKIFDKVIIAIGENPRKQYLFSVDERKAMLRQATKGLPVEIDHFSGLLTDFAKNKGAVAIVKGLRAVSDFEYEFQAALMNRKLDNEIETVFVMTRGMYCYLSSSIVKEVASLGGKLTGLVPKQVESALRKKFS